MEMDHPLHDKLESRLAELRQEHQLGQGRLQELLRQESMLRETLLRISGAIQVLEEMLSRPEQPDDEARQATPAVLRVP